ncbi:SPFH domain-containing protein [Candidatus Sulfurimonas baltica]|uniref:SPFH domain-containing protein n=1 Tax=Candidatus Sulfurimonas baltica TaxID=2740404 RepID=A0A7S7LZ36_9BACT|nr:SPFH domain-containing protein [Candidatus Sulfurimonas baltica]QOY53209.1 SPFH domain-containing protein [Candidatus Sulfurimonas baltica]
MEFVKAKPNEYLVVAKSGKIKNLGVARSAMIWPGQSFIMIPSTQIEAQFAMTQESKDGIPLRFKGIVIYHVENPEIVAQRFDFSENKGLTDINNLIANVSLGELRDKVSHMDMDACIDERKTTLTDAIVNELSVIAQTWGIAINVVQVAQVFIVEDEIRKQLEAEVRNQLRANSELSDIKTEEAIERESSASELRLKKEEFENQKERMNIELERKNLEREHKQKDIALVTPHKIFEAEQDMLVMTKMIDVYEFKAKMNLLKAKSMLVEEIEQNKIRKDMLPLEQVPQIADSVSRMFNGANLSFYNDSSQLMSGVAPMIDMVARALKQKEDID